MKVIGCKVEDNFYNRFAKLGNISKHLRIAAEKYLETKFTIVNHNYPKNEEQTIIKVDKRKLAEFRAFLQSLEDQDELFTVP
jgi:hypothetical protein